MILRKTEPYDPLCERCLKLQKITLAVVEVAQLALTGLAHQPAA
jgi:hypothetical protein